MAKPKKALLFAEAISFAIEFVIFKLFIHQESMQIVNQMLIQIIRSRREYGNTIGGLPFWEDNYLTFHRTYTFFGILALYSANAYATYLFSCMMIEESRQIIYLNRHMNYEWLGNPIFDKLRW